jgi:hypothetical protein
VAVSSEEFEVCAKNRVFLRALQAHEFAPLDNSAMRLLILPSNKNAVPHPFRRLYREKGGIPMSFRSTPRREIF